ncbi:MAG: hypothetical protein ACP5OG_05195 [Candidatus Nanoarchaeia archaeon]
MAALDFLSLENMNNLPPELVSRFTDLISILKAAGIVFIVYIVFLIIRAIFAIIRGRKIDKIYKKLNELDEKISALLNKNKAHSKRKSK